MRFNGQFVAFTTNIQRYQSLLAEELTDALVFGATAYLDATAEQLPVWSGASVATFLPLARAVGFSLAVSPRGSAPNRVQLGQDHGGDGELAIDASAGRFTFTYTTDLPWLVYNEFNNANVSPDPTLFSRLIQPGPYRFQEKGKAAFERAVGNARLPHPEVAQKLRRISFG